MQPVNGQLKVLAVVVVLALYCGCSEQSPPAGEASSDPAGDSTAAKGPLVEAVCNLLTAEEVQRFASGPDVNSEGVYDNFLKPVADVCRYENAFTLQLNYTILGDDKADIEKFLKSGTPGVEVTAISPSGFHGAVQHLLPDPNLGTSGSVLDVTVQVGDWVLILDPDDLFEIGSPESATLQELAGIAARRL